VWSDPLGSTRRFIRVLWCAGYCLTCFSFPLASDLYCDFASDYWCSVAWRGSVVAVLQRFFDPSQSPGAQRVRGGCGHDQNLGGWVKDHIMPIFAASDLNHPSKRRGSWLVPELQGVSTVRADCRHHKEGNSFH